MAQAGFTPISLYFSSTAAAVPSSGNLVNGELALNTADMKLYAKNSAGTVTLLASSSGATGTVSSVAVSGGSTGLTTSGGPITTSGTITLAGTLGTANGGTNLTSFNANGVVYASSSSVLATGSALTFDGSRLTVTGAILFNSNGDSSSATGEIKQLTGSGLTIYSKTGSSYDFTLLNAGGSNLIRNPTGTGTLEIPQTNAWFTSTGLGIGISSPTYKLDISVTTNDGIRTTSSAGQQLYLGNTGGEGVVGTLNNYAFNLMSNGSLRFQIGTAGQFGIGGATYGLAGQVLTSGGASAAPTWASAGGGSGFTAKTTNYTAASGDNILANTSAGSWTLTLPASPSTGNSVQVMDSIGTFGPYPLTVARNGSTIMSAAENMILDVNGAATTFVYNGSTWRVI